MYMLVYTTYMYNIDLCSGAYYFDDHYQISLHHHCAYALMIMQMDPRNPHIHVALHGPHTICIMCPYIHV